MQSNVWQIIAASTQGKSHINDNIPCQDAYYFEYLNETTGIIALSDGAGSCLHSDLGSSFIVKNTVAVVKEFLQETPDYLSSESDLFSSWREDALKIITKIKGNLCIYAEELGYPVKDLSATLILIIFSPGLILVTHIGDGRAGYKTALDEWKSLITPYQGSEVSTTAFITDDFEKYNLIESVIIREDFNAFTLLSDGCEKTCWEMIKEENSKFIHLNKPYVDFYEQNLTFLKSYAEKHSDEEINTLWNNYLYNGTMSFENEPDDKTLIIGFLK